MPYYVIMLCFYRVLRYLCMVISCACLVQRHSPTHTINVAHLTAITLTKSLNWTCFGHICAKVFSLSTIIYYQYHASNIAAVGTTFNVSICDVAWADEYEPITFPTPSRCATCYATDTRICSIK